jgi:putative peptidoglycan lipid II flippase
LSKKHASQSEEGFSNTIDWALRWVFIIGTPAALGLIALAQPLLMTLFQYGEFTQHDAYKASLSLMAYGLGLLPFIFIKVLAPGYFARQDTKTPVKIGIIAMVSNMVLNIILMIYLAHVGLALATALSAALNAALLYIGLRKREVYIPNQGWLRFLLKILIANGVMVAQLWWFTPAISEWQSWTAWQRCAELGMLIVSAAAVYFALLWLLRINLRQLVRPAAR